MILTDTGTTITYLLPDDYDALIPVLCPLCVQNEQFNILVVENCLDEQIDSFQPVWFQIENYLYEMPVESYL